MDNYKQAFLNDNHYIILDYIRCAAIGLVLLRHIIRPFMEDYNPNAILDDHLWKPFLNLMQNGWVGVDIFFILSGFLIAKTLQNTPSHSIFTFYKNRAIRIFPAYFFILLLVCIGCFPFYQIQSENLLKSILVHITFMQDYLGSDINIVYWSLGVEIKFYLLAPFMLSPILKLYQNHKIKAYFILIGIVALGPLSRFATILMLDDFPSNYAYMFTLIRSPFHCCIDSLFLGALCFFIHKDIKEQKIPHSLQLTRACFVGSLFMLTYFLLSQNIWEDFDAVEVIFQPLYIAVITGTLMVSALLTWKKPKDNTMIQYGAKLSYSVYLIHWPLIPLCITLPILLGLTDPAYSITSFWLFFIAVPTLSFLLAGACYRYIEAPLLKLKRRDL